MISVGAIATLLSILNIWLCETWQVIINIIAMLGGGVFCSAIVSWIIEENNKKIQREEKLNQRKFVLRSFVGRLKTYLHWEIHQLSQYCMIEIDDSLKYKRCLECSIEEVISMLQEHIAKTKITIERIHQSTNISPEYLSKKQQVEGLLYKDIVFLLKKLEEEIAFVLTNDNLYYINDLLDNNAVKTMSEMHIKITDIINLSEGECLDLVLELKKDFFDKLDDFLTSLGVNLNEKMNVRIWGNK